MLRLWTGQSMTIVDFSCYCFNTLAVSLGSLLWWKVGAMWKDVFRWFYMVDQNLTVFFCFQNSINFNEIMSFSRFPFLKNVSHLSMEAVSQWVCHLCAKIYCFIRKYSQAALHLIILTCTSKDVFMLTLKIMLHLLAHTHFGITSAGGVLYNFWNPARCSWVEDTRYEFLSPF